jgi:ATP-dependent 26S proteasome regulatory subunit
MVYIVITTAASLATMYYVTTVLLSPFQQQQEKSKKNKEGRKRIFEKLKISNVTLNEYEELIANEVVLPENISESFENIGGNEHIINELTETVVLPLCHPEWFRDTEDPDFNHQHLFSAPKGVLLYGPPVNAF